MNATMYDIAILFFTYSFFAWFAETTVATIKINHNQTTSLRQSKAFTIKDFKNRGFASGPFCFIYGFTAILLTIFLQELRNDLFFLFLGSMVIATVIEWLTGKILERMKQQKWWDYSSKRWNFDGYICLQYSLLWGILGSLSVRYGNGLILSLYHILPTSIEKVIVLGLAVVGFIDFAGSFMSIYHMEEKLPRLFGWNQKLQQWTFRFATALSQRIENRIGQSYPSIVHERSEKVQEKGCSLTQLFWLFFIGALLGDLVETLFCRITMGVWMSRSSLVWGPFSVVWGLAIALITALLYRDKDKAQHHIFWIGTFLGGAYEYICSVFTELVFGKVFWDYSAMPFNLGGRINLLYCFFWGIAAVVWMKGLYPKLSHFIDVLLYKFSSLMSMRPGRQQNIQDTRSQRKNERLLTGIFVIFMIFNICVSMLALIRYDTRSKGQAAVYKWEQLMDNYFHDAKMEQIYPNAKQQ